MFKFLLNGGLKYNKSILIRPILVRENFFRIDAKAEFQQNRFMFHYFIVFNETVTKKCSCNRTQAI